MYNSEEGNEGASTSIILPSLSLYHNNNKNSSKDNNKSFTSTNSEESVYEERLVVEVLSQGVFGHDPGVKNELGQEQGEMLKPHLKSRHVIMISLGTVLGSGLFLGESIITSLFLSLF